MTSSTISWSQFLSNQEEIPTLSEDGKSPENSFYASVIRLQVVLLIYLFI